MGYLRKISVTCDNTTAIHRVRLIRANWVFFQSYFYVGYEWNLGDASIQDTDTWVVEIYNLAVGNVTFTVNVYWIES